LSFTAPDRRRFDRPLPLQTGWWVGEVPDVPGRPWPVVEADVDRLNVVLRPNAEYGAQALLLPGLIRDLLAAVGDPAHRDAALVGVGGCLQGCGVPFP
jgi:hypothetical protein